MSSPSLAWKDNPTAELLRLAGPIATSTISYSLMTLVDTLLIGRVGRAELAGVALGGLAAFVLLCFSIGLLRATNTLVSQATGAGRPEEIPAYRGTAALLGLALGLVTASGGQLLAALLPHLAATPAAGKAAGEYLGIRILGAPLALTYVALREVRYGRGDARSPMKATVAANLTNILFAYLFIFVFGWSVRGAALATLLGSAVELTIILRAGRGEPLGISSARWHHLGDLWRLGAPTGIQFVLEVGSFSILSLLISLRSEAEMAAHQIALQITHLSFLPAWAVAEGAAVLTGQAVGANQDSLVLKVARRAALIAGSYTALCGLIFGLAAGLIATAFSPDARVSAVTINLLYVAAFFQVFDAVNIVSRCVLRGAGDVRFSATVGVVSAWLCTPPLTWLLGWKLGLGALGGWIGLCLEIVVAALLQSWRVQRGGWAAAAERSRARLAERGGNSILV